MKMYFLPLVLAVMLFACRKDDIKKPDTPAAIEYTDFNNKEIKANQSTRADLDKDGAFDIFVYTMLVGDALLQRDYTRYHILSSINNYFPVNNEENGPILNKGDDIAANSFSGYNWYNVTQLLLAQKVTTMNPPPFWEGAWKDAAHKYLPMRIQRGENLYYGWIELSFDITAEKVIMHKAGVSKEAGKAIKAGF